MQFLYPNFLYALGFIAIPILIHLFNFRRYKKIVFSDIRFLKQFTEQNKKQQTLKHLLILLTRALAIAALVLAFAQPFIPGALQNSKTLINQISIYIDNSPSMEATEQNGTLLNTAKEEALKLVNAFPDQDEFNLLTNDFEGKHQRWLKKKDIIKEIELVQPSATFKNAQEIYQRQLSLNAGNPSRFNYWLSDFQTNLKLASLGNLDTLNAIIPILLCANQAQNVWVDSVWFPAPMLRIGANNKVRVKIRNDGETPWDNQPVVLKIDGIQRGLVNLSCAAGATETAEINFNLNDFDWHGFEISITDFPIVYDDVYYLSAAANKALNVLLLHNGEGNSYIETVYGLDSLYNFSSMLASNIRAEVFATQQLIILQAPQALSETIYQELEKFVRKGGVLLAVPSVKMDNAFLSFLQKFGVGLNQLQFSSQMLEKPAQQHPLMAGVFSKLPNLSLMPTQANWFNYTLNKSNRTVISLANGQAWLSEIKVSKGSLYLFGSSLNPGAGNFVQNSLFVPIMLNLPMQAKQAVPASFVVGRQLNWPLPAEAAGKVVQLKSDKAEYRAETRLFNNQVLASFNEMLPKANLYNVLADGKEISKVAFNFPRQESFLKFYSQAEIEAKLGSTLSVQTIDAHRNAIQTSAQGTPLWRYCLIFALLMILVEVLLLRLWK